MITNTNNFFQTHPLVLYNTDGRSLQEFQPIVPGEVSCYCCGPTVYNYAHIGNLRTYIFEDILRRTLYFLGYKTNHVMNVTDVGHLSDDADDGEDKMVASAKRESKTIWDIAHHYSEVFFRDITKLNVLAPTIVCRATDHITDMIALIQEIERGGYTYSAGGNLYFDTQRFPHYGKMALLNRQRQDGIARVEADSNKHHPRDFVLWFTRSKFEHQAMVWDSPWGVGYPGWHIECSAMSMKYLGPHFDIHCGGIDHIPIHHTNEIAQSEASTGKRWVNYWLHAEFLLMQETKMSKSEGGFVTLHDLEEAGFDPLDYRWFCLNGHYRSQLQFSMDALQATRNARVNLLQRIARLRHAAPEFRPDEWQSDQSPDVARLQARLSVRGKRLLEDFVTRLCRDLAIPECMALLWNMLKDESIAPAERLGLTQVWDTVLGLRLLADDTHRSDGEDEIERLVAARNDARAAKQWDEADRLRDQLNGMGLLIEDSPQGTIWYRGNVDQRTT